MRRPSFAMLGLAPALLAIATSRAPLSEKRRRGRDLRDRIEREQGDVTRRLSGRRIPDGPVSRTYVVCEAVRDGQPTGRFFAIGDNETYPYPALRCGTFTAMTARNALRQHKAQKAKI